MLTRSAWTLARALVAALVGLVVLASGSLVALAADYPLTTHGVGTLNGTEFRVGDTVHFRGDTYLVPGTGQPPAGNHVVVTDNAKSLGSTDVDGNGDFEFSFVISSSASLGKHVLVGRGIGQNGAPRDTTAVYYVVGVQVSPQPISGGDSGNVGDVSQSGHTLPFTGSDVLTLLGASLVLMAAGALLVRANLTARRDRRAARRARRSVPA